MRGGPAISPAILNTCLLKVPCTQRMNQLICGPLTAHHALHPRLRPPNGTEIFTGRKCRVSAFGTYNYEITDRSAHRHNLDETNLS